MFAALLHLRITVNSFSKYELQIFTSMDARIVAIFVFLCLSTGYSLTNDDDDDVLDMLQEADNLKEAPEMVSCNAFL